MENRKKYSSIDFFTRAKQIHGDIYDYSLTVVKNMFSPVKITCPKHGEYLQQAMKHLKGSGCPICSKGKMTSVNESVRDVKQTKDEILSMVNLVLKEKEQVGFNLLDWNFNESNYMGDNFTEAYCKLVLDIFNQKFGNVRKETIEAFGDTLQTSINNFPKSYQKQKSSIKTIFEGNLYFHTNMNIDNIKLMIIKLTESMHYKVNFKEKDNNKNHGMGAEQATKLKIKESIKENLINNN